MQLQIQNFFSFSKFSAYVLLITAFIFSSAAIVKAQTLDAFNPNANASVDDIESLPDGKILIGGNFTTIDGQTRNRLARITTDDAVTPTGRKVLDFDGDGKTDFMITRNVSGSIIWYLLTRSGTTSAQYFGSFPGDFTAQDDYDGDGKTDIAVWRNSVNAAFYVQRSNAGFQTFQWGLQGDYPVAYYNAH